LVAFQENNTGKEKTARPIDCLEHSRFFQKVKVRTFTRYTTKRPVQHYCRTGCVISYYEKNENFFGKVILCGTKGGNFRFTASESRLRQNIHRTEHPSVLWPETRECLQQYTQVHGYMRWHETYFLPFP